MTFLIVRVRSDRGVERSIKDTMAMLNLTRVNHATIVPESSTYAGMLQKSKDFVTWGVVDAATIEHLLKERGRMVGDKPVDDAAIKAGIKRAYVVGGALGFRGDEISSLAERMI